MIRIIAGEFRHREIENPNVKGTRPTQDRVREAIFSALSNDVKDRFVLDLFAGSGAYSFEALSRGAREAYMVDRAKECILAMKKTAANLKIEDRVTIIRSDYLQFLKSNTKVFDLVFLDPPYAFNNNKNTIAMLLSLSMLTDNAIIIAEQENELEEIEGFRLRSYVYGYKKVGIYRRIN